MMLTQELDAAERTWRSAGITHYRISVKIDSFATPQPPYVVEVQNGVTLSGMQRYTVSGLFSTVREALANPCQTVRVGFNSPYGYPVLISAKPTVQISDASYSVTVVAFMPLS